MSLKVYNTLTGKIEEIEPIEKNIFRMYSCGPTVYDAPHIGNFRAFLFFDLIKKYLCFLGYKVTHVMNVTDVDDKIIKRCNENKENLKDLTTKYGKIFIEDAEKLGIEIPDYLPHATDHITEMIDLIKLLIEKKYAYKTDNGSVFFNINSFTDYGKLSKIDMDQLERTKRVSDDEYDKRNPQDFALWKAWKSEDGNIFWKSPWGNGRPGWHIECSAMSIKYLGYEFDLHCGGVDLQFPHHENEIAQSVCATGKSFVKTWLHCEHLLVDGSKMSKSAGNFYTLKNLFSKGYSSKAIRYLLTSSHYRQKVDLTDESLKRAEKSVRRLQEFNRRLSIISEGNHGSIENAEISVLEKFTLSMNNDLNISEGLAVLFDWVRSINKKLDSNKVSLNEAANSLALLHNFDSILCFIDESNLEISPQESALIQEREVARKKKNWLRSDEIRDHFKEKGIDLVDTPSGTILKHLKDVLKSN
tara:strand:- start:421 stop:1836 length:1416 start_codon:yes stop_codon:yes gene_type:complete